MLDVCIDLCPYVYRRKKKQNTQEYQTSNKNKKTISCRKKEVWLKNVAGVDVRDFFLMNAIGVPTISVPCAHPIARIAMKQFVRPVE